LSANTIKQCICPHNSDSISNIGRPHTVWTVPAIHGQLTALQNLHDHILQHIRPGDRIVYHGNYTGFSGDSAACITEILTFRRMVLALPGMMPSDIQYLRGRQELIWEKLFQLHYAPNPSDVLLWMLGNGLSDTLYSYGLSPHDGVEACKAGTMGITKWTSLIRKAIRAHPGHDIFMRQLKRAAFTDLNTQAPMLFVHAGLNPSESLYEQGDHFWWACDDFQNMEQAYRPFEKVIRGYDPEHKGSELNCISATIDDACGFGGYLISVGFDQDAQVTCILEA
jgi:serine/threonine protein phosphatase 1